MKAILVSVPMLMLVACGPVNSATGRGGSADKAAVDPTELTQVTEHSRFVFHQANLTTARSERKKTSVGDNVYGLEIFCRNPARVLSLAAAVTYVYWMPEMPDMGTFEARAQRQPDGSYQATVEYTMRGRWQVTIKIEDGALRDQYVFDLKI